MYKWKALFQNNETFGEGIVVHLEKHINYKGLEINRIYFTCYIGDNEQLFIKEVHYLSKNNSDYISLKWNKVDEKVKLHFRSLLKAEHKRIECEVIEDGTERQIDNWVKGIEKESV